jgi:hypothetical protein
MAVMRNHLKVLGVLLALLAVPSVAYAASNYGCCDGDCPCCDD